MVVKSKDDLNILKEGGHILAKILKEVSEFAKPGVKTKDIDKFASELIFKLGAKPSFKGYRGYPFFICTSLNQEVVHGKPSDHALRSGDVLGVDIGIKYQGYFLDSALTVGIYNISKEARKLIEVCKRALDIGVKECKAGVKTGDLGFAIQKFVEGQGFEVIRELCGHGVGGAVHEEPQVPNFGEPGKGEVLKEGQVIAIEPMISASSPHAVLKDKFLWVTEDGSLSAHFEHTVVVTKKGGLILTK